MKPILTATWLGFLAGVATAAVLAVMHALEHLIWPDDAGAARIFVTIMTGAVLIALLRQMQPKASLNSQLAAEGDASAGHLRRAATLAALGIASVAFGGAVGPEAGVLAVIGELSSLVARRIGGDVREQRLINRIGTAGALGAIYGSPPGGASYADDRPDAPWPLLVLAGLAGLAGIYVANLVLPEGAGLRIPLPDATPIADATSLALTLVPALTGAAAGVVYVVGLKGMKAALGAMSADIRVRVLLGSLVFAVMATIWPILRFNGQSELALAAASPELSTPAMLAMLAALKGLALAICLAAGWLGGPIMPLAFVGAAAGLATAGVVPGLDPGLAAAAAVGAAATVGMARPLVVLLVLLFMATNVAPLAMALGVAVGIAVNAVLPDGRTH